MRLKEHNTLLGGPIHVFLIANLKMYILIKHIDKN